MDNKEKIRLAINQISVNNCDGSANEESIKAIRYLQEVSEALTIPNVVLQSEQVFCPEHEPKVRYDWQKGNCLSCAKKLEAK